MAVSNIPINTDPEKSAAVIRITQKKFRGRDTKSIWFTRRSMITKADRMCVLYISDPADLVNQQLAACSSKWGLADGLWWLSLDVSCSSEHYCNMSCIFSEMEHGYMCIHNMKRLAWLQCLLADVWVTALPAVSLTVPPYPVGIVPPRTKSPMTSPESCTIASYVTLRKTKKPEPRSVGFALGIKRDIQLHWFPFSKCGRASLKDSCFLWLRALYILNLLH